MSYQPLKSSLDDIQKELTAHNYREIKKNLIEIQERIGATELEAVQRGELLDATQAIFEKIKLIQQHEQEAFEKEALINFELLKQKVIEAIDFTQNHIDEHEAVWKKLIETQQEFKGKKLIADQREQLFGTLQKLFYILKKRKGEEIKDTTTFHGRSFERLDDEVAYMVKQCPSGDIDKTWAGMLKTKDKVLEADLQHSRRKSLIDKMQEGFDVLKVRRDERQQAFVQLTTDNASVIAEKLDLAEHKLEHSNDFKEKWELLLSVQSEFSSRKLEKETREVLYDRLQDLFQRLKAEQYSNPSDFERLADENFQHLKPLVEKSFEEAHTCTDFKKTKAYLIKVQADFKGRKMRSFEREALFSKLQSAFEILNNRYSESTHTPSASQPQDDPADLQSLQTKIDELQASLTKDLEELQKLEARYIDSKNNRTSRSSQEDLNNQVKQMHATIARKNKELEGLRGALRG